MPIEAAAAALGEHLAHGKTFRPYGDEARGKPHGGNDLFM
jgi:hypothetical protein